MIYGNGNNATLLQGQKLVTIYKGNSNAVLSICFHLNGIGACQYSLQSIKNHSIVLIKYKRFNLP